MVSGSAEESLAFDECRPRSLVEPCVDGLGIEPGIVERGAWGADLEVAFQLDAAAPSLRDVVEIGFFRCCCAGILDEVAVVLVERRDRKPCPTRYLLLQADLVGCRTFGSEIGISAHESRGVALVEGRFLDPGGCRDPEAGTCIREAQDSTSAKAGGGPEALVVFPADTGVE